MEVDVSTVSVDKQSRIADARKRSGETRNRRTREVVTKATEELLRHKGLQSCTVSTICEASGISQASVYKHFGSRDGVIATLCDAWIEKIDDEMLSYLYGHTLHQAISKFVELMLQEESRMYIESFMVAGAKSEEFQKLRTDLESMLYSYLFIDQEDSIVISERDGEAVAKHHLYGLLHGICAGSITPASARAVSAMIYRSIVR